MIQYIVILLDDTSVSFCHYQNKKNRRRLMPLETLMSAIVYAMKENLNIQFVYPDYDLPKEYQTVIDSVDHTDIKPASLCANADVVVFDNTSQLTDYSFCKKTMYVLRTDKKSFFLHINNVCSILNYIERLNIVFTDLTTFADDSFEKYSEALLTLSKRIEDIYISGKTVQLNLLTDRMMLTKMNNCGAGDSSITLAPDGKFYICPAFYVSNEEDDFGTQCISIGNLKNGLSIKNPQLYKLDHAPLCRNCSAYQCKRCIWLNRETTYEVNTPSHEQCVIAHLERNASRKLLNSIRSHGTFLPDIETIKELTYLDPFEVIKDFE